MKPYKRNYHNTGWDFENLRNPNAKEKEFKINTSDIFLICKDFIKKHSLNINQYLTLIILKNNLRDELAENRKFLKTKDIRSRQLADILYVDKANITRYLKALNNKNIIHKGTDKDEKCWFICQKIVQELEDSQNGILLSLSFYSVCNTVESALVLSNIYFDYFLKNKILNKNKMYKTLPISYKTINKHIEIFENKNIISNNGQFSNKFIEQIKICKNYERIKAMK